MNLCQKVRGSNLVLDTGYSDIFHGFTQILQANDRVVPRLDYDRFLQSAVLPFDAMQYTYYSLVKLRKEKKTKVAALGRGEKGWKKGDHGKKGSYSFYYIIIVNYFADST